MPGLATHIRQAILKRVAEAAQDAACGLHFSRSGINVGETEDMVRGIGQMVLVSDKVVRHRGRLQGEKSRTRVWSLTDQQAWNNFLGFEDFVEFKGKEYNHRAAGGMIISSETGDRTFGAIPVSFTLHEEALAPKTFQTRLKISFCTARMMNHPDPEPIVRWGDDVSWDTSEWLSVPPFQEAPQAVVEVEICNFVLSFQEPPLDAREPRIHQHVLDAARRLLDRKGQLAARAIEAAAAEAAEEGAAAAEAATAPPPPPPPTATVPTAAPPPAHAPHPLLQLLQGLDPWLVYCILIMQHQPLQSPAVPPFQFLLQPPPPLQPPRHQPTPTGAALPEDGVVAEEHGQLPPDREVAEEEQEDKRSQTRHEHAAEEEEQEEQEEQEGVDKGQKAEQQQHEEEAEEEEQEGVHKGQEAEQQQHIAHSKAEEDRAEGLCVAVGGKRKRGMPGGGLLAMVDKIEALKTHNAQVSKYEEALRESTRLYTRAWRRYRAMQNSVAPRFRGTIHKPQEGVDWPTVGPRPKPPECLRHD